MFNTKRKVDPFLCTKTSRFGDGHFHLGTFPVMLLVTLVTGSLAGSNIGDLIYTLSKKKTHLYGKRGKVS